MPNGSHTQILDWECALSVVAFRYCCKRIFVLLRQPAISACKAWLVCHGFSVTEHICIRLRRPGLEAELARKAKPSVNAWLNDLIERELAAEPNDWREILHGERPVASEEAFQECLKPE